MKRLLPLFLLLLTLWGCSSVQDIPEPTANSIPETTPNTPTGHYDSGSELELATGGAVQVYPLQRSDCHGIHPLGDGLLLFSGTDITTLTKLSGTNLHISAETQLDCAISPEDPGVQVSEKGITYYDQQTSELVFLDTGLNEVSRLALSDDIQGSPTLSTDRKHLYYCCSDALRVLDLETGIEKLLKEMTFPEQTVQSLHLEDTVVSCHITDSYGRTATYFFSVETGETLWETWNSLELITWKNSYFVVYAPGAYRELLVGTVDTAPLGLYFEDHRAEPLPLPAMDSLVLASTGDGITSLHFFNTTSGLRTAQLDLSGPNIPKSIQSTSDNTQVWILRYDDTYGNDVIYRWDPLGTPTGDTQVYISARLTQETPDLEGLSQCLEKAAEVSIKHGVDVQIWTDAVSECSDDYTLAPEYHAPVILDSLDALDKALAVYPSSFLKQAAKRTSSGTLRICLVRSIDGISSDAMDSTPGLQFWNQEGDAILCLTVNDSLTENLYHQMFHVVDSRVRSTCSAYDNWNQLNPQGFQYDNSYQVYHSRNDTQLTSGSTRAFIDTFSMSFPKEDRARIMEYAMTPGNEEIFEEPAMQAKLYQLCLGIRTAFKLKDTQEPLLWEQYLAEPIA